MFSGRKRAADTSTPVGRPPSPRNSLVQRTPFEHSTPHKRAPAPSTPLSVPRSVSTRSGPAPKETQLYSLAPSTPVPVFVKDAVAHIGDALSSSCVVSMASLGGGRTVACLFVPEMELPSGEVFAARAITWDPHTLKKLHDVGLPAATTAALVLVVDGPGGATLLAATPQGRLHAWAAGAGDAHSVTALVALGSEDAEIIALVHMEGVGPVVVSSNGQHFVVTSPATLAVRRIFRAADSHIASLGRRFSSMFGFGGTVEPTASRAAVGGTRLWIAHERGVQLWAKSGDSVEFACDFALVDSRGRSLLPSLPTATATIAGLAPHGDGVFVLAKCSTDDAAQLLVGFIKAEADGTPVAWKTLVDVEGVLPYTEPSIAVAERTIAVLLPTAAGVAQLAVFDAEHLERPAAWLDPDEPMGVAAVDDGLVLSTRTGQSRLLTRAVHVAAPVPAVFIPADRAPTLVQLGRVFAEYCLDPQRPSVDLDLAVSRALLDQLSKEVANAPPKQDPRWAEAEQRSDASVPSSQIILEQLEEKHARHCMLLTFLQRFTSRGQSLITLGGPGVQSDLDRIQALMALRKEHVSSQDLALTEVISTALDKIPTARSVYQQVDSVEEVFVALSQLAVGELDLDCPNKPAVLIAAVSRVLEVMVTSVLGSSGGPDSRPAGHWLYTNPVRAVLLQQIARLSQALDSKYAEHLLRQALTFALVGLTGLQREGDVQFEAKCSSVIALFEKHRLSWAFDIAERFTCMRELARLCDTHDPSRCAAMSARFRAEGFDEALFHYYMSVGKAASVLQLDDSIAVTRYLDPFADLAWIKHIEKRHYSEASQVLGQLCDREDSDVRAKQTLLSLATLTAFAAGQPVSDQVASTYELLEYQASLARLASECGREDPSLSQRPLPASKLAARFAELDRAEGFNFALELTYYLPDAELPEAAAHIISAAILHDRAKWLAMRDPERAARTTALYDALTCALANGKLRTHLVSSRSLAALVLPRCAREGVVIAPDTFETVWQLAQRATSK